MIFVQPDEKAMKRRSNSIRMDVDLGSSNIVVFIELYVVKFYEVFILPNPAITAFRLHSVT